MASTVEQKATSQPESPTSRFTAVNDKEAPVVAGGPATSNGPPASRRGSDERSNGQPRISPPGQEKLTITTTTTSCESWLPPVNGDRVQYQPPNANEYNPDPVNKRKRSPSAEQNSSSAYSYHAHGLPSTKQTPTTASTEASLDTPRDDMMRPTPSIEQRDPYGSEQYRQFVPSQEGNRDGSRGNDIWHSRQYPPPHLTSDEQVGDILQRASQSMDAQRGYGSPDDDRSSNPYGPYSHREMSAQSDPKKRKRNFSNRTKTGCMTCRKRKKKCDEQRPECNNCLRGGFVCSGYQPRAGQWHKAEQKAVPVPLQSKTDYDTSPYSASSPYSQQHLPQPRREPLPGFRGPILRVEPPHGRHLGMDDEQPSASTIPSASVASPDNSRLLSAISYGQQIPTPITATSSAYPDRQSKEYDRLGPLYRDADASTPQSASSTLPQILHPHNSDTTPHNNPQMAAQLALSMAANKPRTNKEQMLAGQQYYPFDKELVLERERCNGACWRFNSSTNPNNGVSAEERARLFRDILQPREPVISPTQPSAVVPIGRVGDDVVVEAPFNCDYGYNIIIGQEVAIGKNCTILDTCEVEIGDRCHIGPNVNIYTTTLSTNPKARGGYRGPQMGRKVKIGVDCWIGGNVTILPGLTIARGSTIGAGSVVTHDVPEYTIVGGNPARVIRGIGPDTARSPYP